MSRYNGISPFQDKVLTWNDTTKSGLVINSRGKMFVPEKPKLSFNFDSLYAEPTLAHYTYENKEISLSASKIKEITNYIDGYVKYGVDENGFFIGSSPPGTYAAEATSGVPVSDNGEIWSWQSNKWVDIRTSEQILDWQRRFLDELKFDAKKRICKYADMIGEKISGIVPEYEKLSWSDKRRAATSYLAGTADEYEMKMLSSEALITGETLEELSRAILANVDLQNNANYARAVGLIAGQRRVTMSKIDELIYSDNVAQEIEIILENSRIEADLLLDSFFVEPIDSSENEEIEVNNQ